MIDVLQLTRRDRFVSKFPSLRVGEDEAFCVKCLLQRIWSAGATHTTSQQNFYIAISFRHNLHVSIPSILSSLCLLSFFCLLMDPSRSLLLKKQFGGDESWLG